jgi:hypothetical protein
VASGPKLLPGNYYGTSCVFQVVVEEVVGFVQSEQDKYKAMAVLSESLSERAANCARTMNQMRRSFTRV